LRKNNRDALNAYDNALSRFQSRSWASGAARSVRTNSFRTCQDKHSNLRAHQHDECTTRISRTRFRPKIGRPNKFGIPPAYFDADNEPLVDEYRKLFDIMEAPPVNAQNSATPFEDVVDLGIAIARARGLDAEC
jgi:hypothetical protein